PRIRENPDRDFCPFSPRPEVLPRPEPMPRPTRFRDCVAPFAGRSLSSPMVIFLPVTPSVDGCDGDEVSDLEDHPADVRGVGAHHRVADAPESEPPETVLLILRGLTAAPDLGDRDLCLLGAARSGLRLRHDRLPHSA